MLILTLITTLRSALRHLPHHFMSSIAIGGGHVLHWAHSALKVSNGGITWTFSHGLFWDLVGVGLMLHGLIEMAMALRSAWGRLRHGWSNRPAIRRE